MVTQSEFIFVCVHVCCVMYVCTQIVMFADKSRVDFLALGAEVKPTLGWKQLLQVKGERGGDMSGGRGMNMSLIRAETERETLL